MALARKPSLFTVAEPRINTEAGKIEKPRGSGAAAAAGSGSMGHPIAFCEERVKANAGVKRNPTTARIGGPHQPRTTWPHLTNLRPGFGTPEGRA